MTDHETWWKGSDARNDLLAFGFFLVLSLALRTQAFPASVVDWDESLYFLIAKDLRAGFMPYETVFEHKPVGVFLIFALFQTLLGDRIVAMRVATIVAVAISAFLVKAITDLLASRTVGQVSAAPDSSGRSGPIGRLAPGLVAGSLFAVYSTTNWGLAANTEHFFTPLVCGAFLIVVRLILDMGTEWGGRGPERRGDRSALPVIGVGLLMGVALQVKYLVVWETILLGLAILALEGLRGTASPWRAISGRSLARTLLYGGAVVAPTALVVAVFWSRGMWETWLNSNITANIAYGKLAGIAPTLWADAMIGQAASQSVLWVAALLTPIYVLRGRGPNPLRAVVLLLFLWWVAGLIGAASTRLFFPHYFLQPLPAACILSAWLVLVILPRALSWPARGGTLRLARWGLIALVFAQAIGLAGEALWKGTRAIDARLRGGAPWPNDEPARVAEAIRHDIQAGDEIYVVDYHLILYHLVGARWPTRYIFPTHLTTERAYTLDVDPFEEFEGIFAREPRFVIKKRRSRGPEELFAAIQAAIDRDYEIHASIGQVDIYRRRR